VPSGGLSHRPQIPRTLVRGEHRCARPVVVLVDVGADQINAARVDRDLLDRLTHGVLLCGLAAAHGATGERPLTAMMTARRPLLQRYPAV